MKFQFDAKPGELEQAILNKQTPIVKAAVEAIIDAAKIAVAQAKQEITSAGLGGQIARGMRYKLITEGDAPAALLYNRLGFVSIFEYGAHIGGAPLLWLPLPIVPRVKGRQLTPKQLAAKFGKLISIKSPGHAPMLGLRVPVGSGGKIVRLTVAKLKPGKRASRASGVRVVPVYVGVPAVNIAKRLNLTEIFKRAGDLVGTLYLKNLKDD